MLGTILLAAGFSRSAIADDVVGCVERADGKLVACEAAAFEFLIRKLDGLEVDSEKANDILRLEKASCEDAKKLLKAETDFWRERAGIKVEQVWWTKHGPAVAYSLGVGGTFLVVVGGVLVTGENKPLGVSLALSGLVAMALGAGVAF